MKTVHKQHVSKLITRAYQVRSFDLANEFSGALVQSDEKTLKYAQEMKARFSISEDGLTGAARIHSNTWYEFKVREE